VSPSLAWLVEPRLILRSRQPIKTRAAVLGWILAVVSVLLLAGLAVTGIPSVRATFIPGHPGNASLAVVGFVLVAATQVVILAGAIGMIRGSRLGREIVIVSLALSIVFSLIFNVGVANLAQFVLQLVIRGIAYYFAVISRFPEESTG